MNNIYKVIWSKAKNCYVVASEIARSHTKSATGSEKIGGVTRRSLLASLMALSLLCGGLGVASAVDGTVNVDESTPGTAVVYTTEGTQSYVQSKLDGYYTKAGVDDKIDEKIEALTTTGAVATNKDNIGKLQTKTNKLSDDGTKLTNMIAVSGATVSANKVNAGALNVTGQISNGTVTTTLADINESMTQTDANKADIVNLKTTTGKQDTAIKDLQKKTTNISYADGVGTSIDGITVKDGNIVGNGNSAITQLANVETDKIKTDSINGKSLTGTNVATEKNVADAVKTETDARTEADKALGEKITKNSQDIATLNGKVATAEGNITDLEKKIQTNVDNIQTNKNDITTIKQRTAGIDRIDATNGTTIEGNVTVNSLGNVTAEGDVTATGKLIGDGVDAGSLNVENASHLKGDVTMDNKLSVTGDTSLGKTDVGGALNVTGASDLKGNVTLGTPNGANTVTVNGKSDFKAAVEMDKGLTVTGGDTTLQKTDVKGALSVTGESSLKNTTVGGTLGVTGATTLSGELTAEKNATFEKDVTVRNDLTVDGKLNVGEISMKNNELKNGKKHDSATTITADEISNLAKVTEQGNTTESQFTHNEKGTFNHARDGNNADWKESNSNVTADGVSNKMTDSDGNRHTYYQTAAETKEQLVNGNKSNFDKKTAEGNTISIKDKDADGNKKSLTNKQTVDGEKTSVTNKDSSSTVNQGADQIRNYVASTDGTKSSTEVKADGITNTSDGTITNDANHIENKANTMDTTVTGKATENYGELETTVNGNQTTTVTGNVKEDYKKDLTTTVGGNELHEVTGTKTENVTGKVTENYNGGQETNVKGNQDIKVSGTQTTTATDIKRNASSGMIDTIDNDYGTNTETKVAGKTTTDVSIKGTEEKGQYIRGANESRDYLIKGTLKNSETKTVEKTSTEITDGNGKTSATIQDKTQISGSVTNGTSSAVSNVKADSIDTAVIEGTNTSLISQKKDSITSAVGNGTTSTVIQQGDKDITIASNGGTVGIVGKDIINNATNEITNTAGTKITDKVGNNTRVIDQTSITDTVGTASRKIEDGKITDTAGDSTVTTENGKGTTFAKAGSAAYSTEAGATKDTNIAGNHITTGRVDANELGVSDKDGANTADLSVKAGEGVKASAGNGNTTGSLDVKADGITTSITNGTDHNTVSSTLAGGTIFSNSGAAAPVTGASGDGTHLNTTVKGNTITTGKVTMDYAEVMKDLGVHGSAKVDNNLEVGGTTTTKTLNVTENATVGGTLDVTQRATFHDAVDIAKDLSVGGNATIAGDVTAKSYKVGDKTYIDANGINANNQKITNVADGSISEGSKDAVNGGQLYDVKRDMEHKVDKVGANAAAMANLRPMEFDPSSKWNIAAAIGNYGSETAAALGAFYRPNDDVMVNLSTAFGTGENMVGGGVSVRLGKGGNKLSREETNALKDQVNDLTARMDALLSVLNPNMSKDFPDVPENHWAYEAVSRLAGNDIVQGYPDGEFHGERTMTRYEMAEIIYNALSRGAEAERELVEEFKPELQAMAASEKATAERAEG